ncbi:hypothetical protein BU26DRAFT_518599 [Trematosphaeria pertusa]|uniref:CENP-V/GFA domain-containing protein n=1 Tax=Trematosphaeria pertusa TaxID=390896 RepID=A0A6A6IIC8_9PLEO|nr:uncharacterized protein BU26DRAFT_518599 [Trematosphaeria pertusa]KAF2250161.1 hypothetical protein BU26DRAFT_518599 [Trematosphaeria pertusa]
MSGESTFHAACHCKASKLSFTVPTRSLPLPTHFCNCSVCRHTHGTLCSIHAPIPPPVVDLSAYTAYASSDVATRYFCSTCGAHMFDRAKEPELDEEKWYVAASMVDAPEEIWDFHSHFNLEGTGDGGLATWLRDVGGKKLKMWTEKAVYDTGCTETGDWKPSPPAQPESTAREEKLKARCHCGGVQFYISRPRADEAFTHMPETLTPKDKTKWYAAHDVCTSCRLLSGCAIVSWMFPEISHISLPDGSPYKPVFGTIKTYASSPGVLRTFCGTCGALVTYSCDDRPQMVDVGVGLLDAGSGARAEEWLEWRTHKVVYEEDCGWKGVLEGLKSGLRAWAEERDGEGRRV